MTGRLSTLAGLTLALTLALTSVAVGAVRGQADATGKMVICSSHGLVVLYTDENGDPTGAPHLCPDCVVKLLSADPAAPAVAHEGLIAGTAYLAFEPTHAGADLATYGPGARAPPAMA